MINKGLFEMGKDCVKKKSRVGRKEKWSPKELDALAEDIADYADLDTSLDVLSWRSSRGLTRDQIQELRKKSAKFKHLYDVGKEKIGARRLSLTYKGDFSEGLLARQEWNYDADIRARQDELRHPPKNTEACNADLAKLSNVGVLNEDRPF